MAGTGIGEGVRSVHHRQSWISIFLNLDFVSGVGRGCKTRPKSSERLLELIVEIHSRVDLLFSNCIQKYCLYLLRLKKNEMGQGGR